MTTLQLSLSRMPALQRGDGAHVPLGSRDGALLVWMALEGPMPRARMAQLLWPESGPEAARNALRQRLFQLRRTLGSELIVGTHTGSPERSRLGSVKPLAAADHAQLRVAVPGPADPSARGSSRSPAAPGWPQ